MLKGLRYLLAALALACAPLADAQLQGHVNLNLLNAATATGPAIGWPGGVGVFTAVGTWTGGGTATLEYLGPDGTTYIAVGTGTTCTANCNSVFYLPAATIKVVISGTVASVTANVAE